ncbi:MAG TPA: chemotaxis protein CheB, partial [Myxococcaceae bacterium]|nr:chemotaxis protein CheB [Myxococcaceae bacterium]
PHVMTLDMAMPGADGIRVTEEIMATIPTPILIVSAAENRGEVLQTFDALAAGAMDVLEKPSGDANDTAWETQLRKLVKRTSRVTAIRRPKRQTPAAGHTAPPPPAPSQPVPAPRAPPRQPAPAHGKGYQLVAIGASTGGPGAVAHVLSQLPARFPLPVLVVIHIGRLFGESLAQWLDTQGKLRVTMARDGEPLPVRGEGRVVLAPPDRHLLVERGRLRLDDGPERNYSRPSVDVLFDSLAQEMGAGVVAALLTGMGNDGASGLLKLRQAGGLTIAQDETSSVVYGMPRAAVRMGAAGHILALPELAHFLVTLSEPSP